MWLEHWRQIATLRLRSLFRGDKVDREIDDELLYHVERQTELYVERGLSRADARREAVRALGAMTSVKEDTRAMWPLARLELVLQDLRFGARILKHSPGLSATAA